MSFESVRLEMSSSSPTATVADHNVARTLGMPNSVKSRSVSVSSYITTDERKGEEGE